MKRWFCLSVLMMAMMCCLCALAEDALPVGQGYEVIPAVAAPAKRDGTVPLFDKPDERSAVLMRYFPGARLEVIRVMDGGLVQVQAGNLGASVMGYMRRSDLRMGAQAQREIQPRFLVLGMTGKSPLLYGYCDAQAPVIGTLHPEVTYYAMGVSDNGWAQLFYPYEHDSRYNGFVRLEDMTGTQSYSELSSVVVESLPGEVTAQDAYALAVAHLLDNSGLSAMRKLPQNLRSAEGLMSMDATVRLRHNFTTGETGYDVYLQDGANFENNVNIWLTPEGDVTGAERGNG